jgi:tartrate dehydrogenase/decarboxylase/D-malate dehydrogenase
MTAHKIALIPKDGIGVDVTEATLRVLTCAADRFGFALAPTQLDWSCDWYLRHGAMVPADGVVQVSEFEAIFLGAVG